jgi:hypothetical protein
MSVALLMSGHLAAIQRGLQECLRAGGAHALTGCADLLYIAANCNQEAAVSGDPRRIELKYAPGAGMP